MEYFDLGNRENGTYMIRPNVELHSFEVRCEFTNSQGLTILRTKNSNDQNTFPNASANRCTDPNCFSKSIEYYGSNEQIEVGMVCSFRTKPFFRPLSNDLLLAFRKSPILAHQ